MFYPGSAKTLAQNHELDEIIQNILDYNEDITYWRAICLKYSKDLLIHKIFKRLSLKSIFIDQYTNFQKTIHKILGTGGTFVDQGSYGDVFRYGSKVTKNIIMNNEGDEIYMLRELIFAAKIQGTGALVDLELIIIHFDYTKGRILEVVEIMPYRGIALQHIKENFNLQSTITAVMDICDKVAILHRMNLCHRDLKLGNILNDETGISICDFGSGGNKDIVPSFLLTTYCYSPPETLEQELNMSKSNMNGEAVDAFSILCIGYNLLCFTTVFMDKKNGAKETLNNMKDILFNKKLDNNIFGTMLYNYQAYPTVHHIKEALQAELKELLTQSK